MGQTRRDAIDAVVTSILPGIVAAQDDYRRREGKYWQGLRSDRPTEKPPHRKHTWADVRFSELLGFPVEKLDGVYTVDEYVGPRGAGFVLRVEVTMDDGLWRKAWAVGPHPELGHEWTADRAT